MKPRLIVALLLVAAGLCCPHSGAIPEAGAAPAPARKYAADREAQVLHLVLDVTPDFNQRSVRVQAKLRFQPLYKPLRELKLDAKDLRVSQLTATEPVQGFQSTAEKLIVTFTQDIPPEKVVTITVDYEAEPKEGLYFRTPAMGYREGDTHLFTQGEEILARNWYPCVDEPNAMFTSETICRVPDGMTVISNGKLVSERVDSPTGLRVFHWSQEQPHANYLITLVAGYFNKVEDEYRGIPLAFFTPPSDIEYAANSFRNTKNMMQFFEEEIGVPYPWPKYYQVCVNDFVAGGMENTSATTLTDGTLFASESENLRDSDGLVAHELAHQWFGDLVTCKDWSHIWLNEGFATYYEALYQGYKDGREGLLAELYGQARMITGQEDARSIVRRDFERPGEMFGYLSYQKGGWVLHMLRAQLGADTFRKCVRTYLERHRHSNVVTEDLRRIIEEHTGRTFDQFFDQWVYHAGFPKLQVEYSWDEPRKLARVSVRQTQKTGPETLLFNVPLTVRFQLPNGPVDRSLQITQVSEDFYVPLPAAPRLVRLDPEYTLLADLNFSVPGEMLKLQIQDQEDYIGRLLAVNEYGKRRDQNAVKQLRDVLKHDPSPGVRVQASSALGGMQTDEALTALLEATEQPDARVRRQVVEDIGRFYREKARDFALQIVEREKNPDIRAMALANLAAYSSPDLKALLLQNLGVTSFRNRLADTVIRAMRDQADPDYIAPIVALVREHPDRFTSYGLGQAFAALAVLARETDSKNEIRELLVAHLDDHRRAVRTGAMNALGQLGDPRATAPLRKIASGGKQARDTAVAEAALAEIRKQSQPVQELTAVRTEVLKLQKSNEELKKQMEELKNKFEALGSAAAITGTPPKPAEPAVHEGASAGSQ